MAFLEGAQPFVVVVALGTSRVPSFLGLALVSKCRDGEFSTADTNAKSSRDFRSFFHRITSVAQLTPTVILAGITLSARRMPNVLVAVVRCSTSRWLDCRQDRRDTSCIHPIKSIGVQRYVCQSCFAAVHGTVGRRGPGCSVLLRPSTELARSEPNTLQCTDGIHCVYRGSQA
jgi:hypothetical protein